MTGLSPAPSGEARALNRARWAAADSWTITRRNLLYLRHNPTLLVLAVAAPVGFLLAFTLLFSGAISVPGGQSYQSYLLPGILAMNAVLGLAATAGATAADADLGVVDRLKAMPTSRVAVPFGQAAADLVLSTFTLGVSAAVGFALGWRPHGTATGIAAAFALLIAVRCAITFLGVWLGLVVRQESTVQQIVPLIVGTTMFSNGFVPTTAMTPAVRVIADWNPVSAFRSAAYQLFERAPAASGPWPLAHPVIASLGWTALALAIFAPLSVRRYARVP